MKCEDIKLLLSDDELTSAVKEHISLCNECRDFRHDIEVIMKNPKTFETTEEIDRKVLNFARENRPAVKKDPIPFYIWTAIAAAAILVFGFVMMKKAGNETNKGENMVKKQEIIIKKDAPEIIAKENQLKVQYSPESEVDDLQMILEDNLLDAEMGALEGALIVLGSEFLN